MNSKLPWDNFCRLCGEKKSDMIEIFGDEGSERKIPQKLRDCLPVMVYKTDPLPKYICQLCSNKIDDVFQFKENCLNVFKSMHLKLITMKDDHSIQIFLDAMKNSSDPCQVQLCKIKQRAPPPLVPLWTSAENNNSSCENQPGNQLKPLVEIPYNPEIRISFDSFNDVNIKKEKFYENEQTVDNLIDNNEENEDVQDKKPSILERVLTGNLTTKWWCSPCNSYYKSKESLDEHIQLNCPGKYSCGKCSLNFQSVEDLAKHEGKNHLQITLDFERSLKKCNECDREFVSWEMLKYHRLYDHFAQSIDIKESTWCSICNRYFLDGESYRNHKKLHDQDANLHEHSKSLTCPTCGKVCTMQSALSNHMRIHEPKKFKCDICGRYFGLYIRLEAHRVNEHNQESAKSAFTDSIEQEEALNAEREAREARGAKIKSERVRAYSKIIDKDENPVEDQRPAKRAASLTFDDSNNYIHCGICQKAFKSHSNMLMHLQTHSESSSIKNYNCSLCEKSFKEKWQLQRHSASHNRGKIADNECSICIKTFPDELQLKIHEKTHIVDKTYNCRKCDKIFFKESSLITHKCDGVTQMTRRNSQSKNFDNENMMNFSPPITSGTSIPLLEPEVQIKEDEIPLIPLKRTLIKTSGGYRCGVCQSPFILRELAVAHLKSAHPVIPYQCPYCQKRFTTQYIFTHHVKQMHQSD